MARDGPMSPNSGYHAGWASPQAVGSSGRPSSAFQSATSIGMENGYSPVSVHDDGPHARPAGRRASTASCRSDDYAQRFAPSAPGYGADAHDHLAGQPLLADQYEAGEQSGIPSRLGLPSHVFRVTTVKRFMWVMVSSRQAMSA